MNIYIHLPIAIITIIIVIEHIIYKLARALISNEEWFLAMGCSTPFS